MGELGTHNCFTYCLNQPTALYDPFGHAAEVIIGTGEGLIAILGAVSAIIAGLSLYSALTSSSSNTKGIIKNATDAAASKKGIDPKDTYGHSVYVLVDPQRGNNVAYVGRSKQPQKRAQQHKKSLRYERARCNMEIMVTGLTEDEAKLTEQTLISVYTLDALQNARREIARGNIIKYLDHSQRVIDIYKGFTEDELYNLLNE